jgi:hypothetical protein
MKQLAIQIKRCLDNEHDPGWIECDFVDGESRRHAMVDKIPIFSIDPAFDPLDSNPNWPQPAGVPCEISNAWCDPLGRELARITTDRPWHVESTVKLSEFVVFASQLSDVSMSSKARDPTPGISLFPEL